MQLKYINSASVLISEDDTSIICDPWLVDGEYYGSWYIYPPLKVKPQDFDNVNAIYISHIHPGICLLGTVFATKNFFQVFFSITEWATFLLYSEIQSTLFG